MGATDVAYTAIRSAIFSGDFPPGHRLREEELADCVGVSRTPVREALRRLAAEGLVVVSQNRTAHVIEWTDQDLEEIFGLRALLESYGVRLATSRLPIEQLDRLRALADEMEKSAENGESDWEKISLLNNEFHQIIMGAAGNARLLELVTGLVQVSLVYRTYSGYNDDHLRRSLAHHRELIAAIGARDPDWAESVMRSHILAARSVLL